MSLPCQAGFSKADWQLPTLSDNFLTQLEGRHPSHFLNPLTSSKVRRRVGNSDAGWRNSIGCASLLQHHVLCIASSQEQDVNTQTAKNATNNSSHNYQGHQIQNLVRKHEGWTEPPSQHIISVLVHYKAASKAMSTFLWLETSMPYAPRRLSPTSENDTPTIVIQIYIKVLVTKPHQDMAPNNPWAASLLQSSLRAQQRWLADRVLGHIS